MPSRMPVVHCFTGRSIRALPSASCGCTDRLPGALPCRSMKLIVRNMVCDRCRAAVQRVLEAQGLPVQRIELGEVELLRKVLDSER